MRKNDYIKTMRAMHMPDDMRTRILHRMAQENTKEVPISMFKHKKKPLKGILRKKSSVKKNWITE